ncbi:lytic murein transglycosylase [Salinarimonas chemoclinalis]|uniref:lytic murein transglycosylase n=1 Tax=Salinarimonas chemoclinalis TaxID=3241599 RepID=UPI003556DBCE
MLRTVTRQPFPRRARALAVAIAATALPLGGCTVAGAGTGIGEPIGVATASLDARAPQEGVPQGEFGSFVAGLWPEAQARGVSRATFDGAFAGVTPNPRIIELTQRQSEFTRPIWEYIDNAVSAERIRLGEAARTRYASILASVERTYGVPQAIVLGVWGMETNFGGFTGNMDVIRSLATLAHARHRGDFFRGELLAALEILETGKISRGELQGSWAGAMGHTQFMPTSYLRFAVDGDGDGKRDIWRSIPDALASTANYLKEHGWRTGLPWGVEVRLPAGFDFAQRRMPFASWAALGVTPAAGGALPAGGAEATLFLPAGARGPAFLVTANYDVIKRYNSSDSYAMGVALLGQRLTGGGGVRGDWPRNERMLDASERRELQTRLAGLGLYDGTVDGKIGSMTREAVRSFQLSRGLTADGYADVAVLEALRGR